MQNLIINILLVVLSILIGFYMASPNKKTILNRLTEKFFGEQLRESVTKSDTYD